MDIEKDTGINFHNVILDQLEFHRKPQISQNPEIEIKFELNNNFSEDKKKLTLKLTCKIFEKTKSFNLLCSMVGIFSITEDPNLTLEEFSRLNAPALMLPYIREIIASTTTRAGMAPIVLPPMNLIKILKNEQSIEHKTSQN